MNKLNYTYDEVHNLIKHGSTKLKDFDFNPDYIIAISGGGLIPARMLRNFIDVPIISLTINFYNEKNIIQDTPNVIQMVDEKIVEGKNILIVDEVDDTRTTLGYLMNFFRDKSYNIKNLGIFVINNKRKNKEFELPKDFPYVSCAETNDIWINYPWENKNFIV